MDAPLYFLVVDSVVLDTGAGPNLIREDVLSDAGRRLMKPVRFNFRLLDASGKHFYSNHVVTLKVKLGKTWRYVTFLVVDRLAVP